MKILFLSGLLFFNQLRVAASDIFYWNWSIINSQIKVSGRLNNQKEIAVIVDMKSTAFRFVRLHIAIEETKHQDLGQYLLTVDTLSNELVKPFIKAIRQCQAIVVNLDLHLLYAPLEVLLVDSQQLALFRPMIFQMNDTVVDIESDTLKISKGLILRDTTVDTDNNCQVIMDKYPHSELRYIHQLDQIELARNHNIDFLLVSSHGAIDGSNLSGGIKVNDSTVISEEFLKSNNPRLVYMDACGLGLSVPYLYTLSLTNEINYYIGSIISVDISDAATRTLQRFFWLLERNHNPSLSLWKTKEYCFRNYGPEHVKSILTTINKSLMFRIYRL